MAGKFVELTEAAKMLGVSAEELKEMRSRGEIFGYRDGASWKFKLEEVERVMGERQDLPHSDSAILSANDQEFDNLISGLSSTIQKERQETEGRDSILLSDDVLGPTGASPSTIIGEGIKAKSGGDSDLTLAGDSGKGSFIAGPASAKSGLGSDVLGDADLLSTGSSKTGELPKSAAGTGEISKDELSLGDDLILDDSASSISKKGLSSKDLDLDLTLADSQVGKAAPSDSGLLDDSSLELGDEMSVLGAESPTGKGSHGGKSGKGSDVTLNTGTSGINLAPSDSGIGLDEEPLELGGSLDDSLELPEDNDIIALEEEVADPDQATRLKRDDQFMLAPAGAQDDEEDSGSQVIALEDSSFDQDAATMLGQGNLAQPALVPEDPFAQAQVMPGVGGFDTTLGMPGDMGGMVAPGMQPQMAGMAAPGMAPAYAPAPVELPYSIWNVLSLMTVAGVLALTGMMMVDVMHNMWQFDANGSAASAVMDGFLGMFNLDK